MTIIPYLVSVSVYSCTLCNVHIKLVNTLRESILNKVIVLEELKLLRTLPTLAQVLRSYFWKQHQLQVGKGPVYRPSIGEGAKLFVIVLKKHEVIAQI